MSDGLFPGEREAVATVVELGSHYGYGNLISHLQTAWARHLMATMGLPEQAARAASGGRGYDFDWQSGILEAAKKARAK